MLNPLYFPLYFAVPFAFLQLVNTRNGPLHIVDFVTFILVILYLFVAGLLGVTAKKKGWKLLGWSYLLLGVLCSVFGVVLIER